MPRILFLAANPENADTLLAGDELRQIEAALKNTPFQVIAKPAARLNELPDLLRQYKPQIVHFSGHGSRYGELMFVDDSGQSQSATVSALSNLFALFNHVVRCVVLNACYSEEQAAAVAENIDCVLGFEGAIRDDAARIFAYGFYAALAAGETLAVAPEHGIKQSDLKFPGALVDFHRSGRADPSTLRPLEWQDTSKAQANAIYGQYSFNQYFFGRNEELDELHNLLQRQSSVSICPVITGMGGLGKTQLAAHYARRHLADYRDGIFWVTAADLNSVGGQLADFCVTLGLSVADPQRQGDLREQKIGAFKHYLDQHPNALLIFDNVAVPDHLRTRQLGAQWTAFTLGGKLLITTRRRKLESDRFVELPLQRLPLEPARQILTTARADLAHDPDLDQLCAQFGFLPLMLNLAAAALKKRGGAIAGYLQKVQALGAEKLHHDVAKVNLDDYHKGLTAVLNEQWAMLEDENARLLLRVAGQLREAEVLPIARLGLLSGLQDVDDWERPLHDALAELEEASLIEPVDAQTIRLHPLVRDFAESLTPLDQRLDFRTQCAQHIADAYLDPQIGMKRLGEEYASRGIFALISDLLIAIEFFENSITTTHSSYNFRIQSILRLLQHEAHKLSHAPTYRKNIEFWQQVLFYSQIMNMHDFAAASIQLLEKVCYWRFLWPHKEAPTLVGHSLSGYRGGAKAMALLDSSSIITASNDHTLKVWNVITGELMQTLVGHKGWVFDVAVIDSNRVISASFDKTLKVWNLQTGQIERTLIGHKEWVSSVVRINDKYVASASSDRTVKIWNIESGEVETELLDTYMAKLALILNVRSYFEHQMK